MRKIRVAQIGTSKYSHGNEIFGALVKNSDVFELVGYALPEGEREKFPDKMKRFEGHREMTVDEILNDKSIEAVVIETEEIYLTKYALMAAERGKHIHMEKPGGLSLGNFEKLIETVKKNGTVFHTGYMYRYNPAIKDIIKRVKAGEIGEVISVEAQMSGYRGFEHTNWLGTFGGGMMFYLGCHLIDLVLRIQGEPKRIIPFNKATGTHDTDAKDFSFAVLEYERGASFVKTTQSEMGGFLRRQLVITGTRGKFEIRPLEITVKYPEQYTEYNECFDDDWNAPGTKKKSEIHDRYTDMMRSFAKMVSGDLENPYTYDYELTLFKTILKCCE
ncbi:MAG: Gfo/Idh/MocA family oxidoreductase [Ruminococcaceae bacterium]|nr:Gfo/Idh/MocA family oxidoreductase [Oscillospiraceae bacterium]